MCGSRQRCLVIISSSCPTYCVDSRKIIVQMLRQSCVQFRSHFKDVKALPLVGLRQSPDDSGAHFHVHISKLFPKDTYRFSHVLVFHRAQRRKFRQSRSVKSTFTFNKELDHVNYLFGSHCGTVQTELHIRGVQSDGGCYLFPVRSMSGIRPQFQSHMPLHVQVAKWFCKLSGARTSVQQIQCRTSYHVESI